MRLLRCLPVLAFALYACGDDEGATGETTTTASTGTGAGEQGGGGAGGAPTTDLVVGHLLLGDRTFAGMESPDAWEDFGFDIDGMTTRGGPDMPGHCQVAGGAQPNKLIDGPNGIDNSWGRNQLPILAALTEALGVTDLDAEANGPIADGAISWVFDIGPLATAASMPSPGAFYEVRDRMVDTWLRAPESFSGESPLTTFPNATSEMSAWSSGTSQGSLSLRLQGLANLTLEIHNPHIELAVDANGDVKAGRLGGVLETEAFLASVETAYGPLVDCAGGSIDGIINQLRQGSDIMADGTQNEAETCTGISIGLGFSASDQFVGGFAPPYVPPGVTCP